MGLRRSFREKEGPRRSTRGADVEIKSLIRRPADGAWPLHTHRATIARLHAALTLAGQAGQPWWRGLVWDPRHDRRIPVRAHEPLEGQRLNFARVGPAWLREAIQWYFAAGLSTGLLSWSSLPSFLSYLGRHFAGFLAAEGIGTPVLDAGPDAGIRPVALRLAAWLRQQRTRSGRPLAPSTIGLIQTTVAGFHAFMADRRAEAARELAEPRWAGLTHAHARWWRPGEIAGSGSYRGQAEGNYIDAAALSRIAGHVEILGLPRDQARVVTVNGTPRQIRGLGDEQAMRAFLLAIATGRRINEILMMDFAPLSPVPGLDTSQAAHDGGPAARLRYQQTKIAGAPQAILVGVDVVAIVTEQQDFAHPGTCPRSGRSRSGVFVPALAGQHRRPAPLPREHPERAAHPARRRTAGHRRHRGGGGLPAHPPDAPH